MYESGLSYSSLNVARSAVAQFLHFGKKGETLGKHPLVTRFFDGLFRLRPPAPRYSTTWDVTIVLKYLGSELANNEALHLKEFSQKTVTLLALLSGQRCQTLHAIKIDNISFSEDSVVIVIDEAIKQSRPGVPNPVLEFKSFCENRAICIVECLRVYLKRTETLRKTNELFLSYIKPHKAIGKNTVSRWVKEILTKSGIDTSVFKAHSTRSASTSSAKESGLPLTSILETAGWSNARTFHRFYYRQLGEKKEEKSACKDFAVTIQTSHHAK